MYDSSHLYFLIGDYAVKNVGVIPQPEISKYTLTEKDRFLVLASDGVWEFMEPQVRLHVI